MADRVRIIEFNNKKINFVDYTNLKSHDAFIQAINEVDEFNQAQINSGVNEFLILSDLSNSYLFGESLKAMQESGNKINLYMKKVALMGLTNSKRILLNAMNIFLKSDIKAFENIEDAKVWLTAD